MKGMLAVAQRIMAVTVVAGAVQLQADGKTALVEAGSSGVALRNDDPLSGPGAAAIVDRLLVASTVSGPVRLTLQTHDENLKQLFEALKARNSEAAAARANDLSELWQALRQLAAARLHPPAWRRLRASIAQNRDRYGHLDDSDRLLVDRLEMLGAWIEKVEDGEWLLEIDHVCKQMEEYAEEIRDGGRESDLGFSYIEHCMPGFLVYCHSITVLPWNSPAEPMQTSSMVQAIRRGLEIARREILYPDNREARRFIKRSVAYAQTMARAVRARCAEDGNGTETSRTLAEAIDLLQKTAEDAERRGHELQAAAGVRGSGFRLALKERPVGAHTVAEMLIEQIVTALDVNQTLAKTIRKGRP